MCLCVCMYMLCIVMKDLGCACECIYVCVCVRSCMYVCVHVNVCVHSHVCERLKVHVHRVCARIRRSEVDIGYLPQSLLQLFLRYNMLLNLALAPRPPQISLLLLPQCWSYKCAPLCLVFLCRFWGSNSRLLVCLRVPLPVKPPHQPCIQP